MHKRIKKLIVTGIVLLSLSIPTYAKAYNVGGNDKVTIKSWDLNDFGEEKDLWTQIRQYYNPLSVSGKFVGGDFDGDGKDELVSFYDHGSSTTTVFFYDADKNGKMTERNTWKSYRFGGDCITDKVVSGDFDGDGKDEIAAMYDYGNHTTGMFTFTYEDPNAEEPFKERKVWESSRFGSDSIMGMVAGDFNGDGKDEIVVLYTYGGNSSAIFEFSREGDRKFNERKIWSSENFNAERAKGRIVAGDYFGTGKDDIVMFYDYGSETGALKFTRNDGEYSVKTVWESSRFGANRINNKVTSTRYKDGRKDKIVGLYDYGNNETGVFTWRQSGSSGMMIECKEDEINYEADRLTNRVAVGNFYGDGTQFVSMYDGTIVKAPAPAPSKTKGELLVDEAYRHLGKEYKYGAIGPYNFDCSGLTQYVYKKALGIDITRTTFTQINQGKAVSKDNLQLGDLVFPNTGHVGIYIGGGKMIHAPHTGTVVRVESIGSIYAARRII